MTFVSDYSKAAAIIVISIFAIAFYSRELARNKHGSDVRVIWYFFALAALLAYLLASWGQISGAINEKGEFKGATGEVLSFLLNASLDLNSSVLLCLAVACLLVLPQFISYIFSGLAGCATAPILVDSGVWLVAWGLIKSSAVASGVLMVIPLFAQQHNWSGSSQRQVLEMCQLSVLLLMVAFSVAYMYRGLAHVPAAIIKFMPTPILEINSKCRRWLTRHMNE